MSTALLGTIAALIAAVGSVLSALGGFFNHNKLVDVKTQVGEVKSDTQTLKNGAGTHD